MVNEREEKYEGHDESEYHFSDDQSTYELEPEIEADAEAPKQQTSSKEKALTGLNRYRRMIIAVVVFFVVLFVVYKLIVPPAAPPATEFAETTNGKTTPAKPMTVPPPQPAAVAVQTPAAPTPAQTIAPPQTQVIAPPPSPPVAEMPAPPSVATPPASVPTQTAQPAAQTIPAPPTQTFSSTTQTYNPPGPAAVPASVPSAPPVATNMPPPPIPADKAQMLEQQNSKLLNIVEAEYTQKLAEFQSQNAATQAKLRELNTRLANMEATLNQLTQAILNKPTTPMPMQAGIPAAPLVKVGEPKMAYTVQAIIPGRAWLKSDAGDTVTVAEGDILKDYGRVTKIDPYDGIVEIDTGNKTISLSYGSSGD